MLESLLVPASLVFVERKVVAENTHYWGNLVTREIVNLAARHMQKASYFLKEYNEKATIKRKHIILMDEKTKAVSI